MYLWWMENTATETSARLVPQSARPDFLPRLFGRNFMLGERYVYSFMRKLCPSYAGGLWDFYNVPKSGYLALQAAGPITLSSENGFSGEVSRDAAGIIVTLYALSHLAARTYDDLVVDHFHYLRNFAGDHPEAKSILAAID